MKDSRHATSAGGIFRRVYALGRSGKAHSLGAYGSGVCQQLRGLLGLAAVIPVIGLVVEPELMARPMPSWGLSTTSHTPTALLREKRFLTVLVRTPHCRISLQNPLWHLVESCAVKVCLSRGASDERRSVASSFFRLAWNACDRRNRVGCSRKSTAGPCFLRASSSQVANC